MSLLSGICTKNKIQNENFSSFNIQISNRKFNFGLGIMQFLKCVVAIYKVTYEKWCKLDFESKSEL